MSATLRIILDTRRMKEKTGTFPVKLKVIYNCLSKDYPTVFDLTDDAFKKLSDKRTTNELQDVREKLKEIEREAGGAIKAIQPFTFSDFEHDFISENSLFRVKKQKEKPVPADSLEFDFTPYLKRFPIFTEDHSRPGCISRVFFAYIKKLLQEERIGNALNYQSTFSSIKKFKGNLLFTDITPALLFQYEKWMLSRGCTLGTVGIKLRPLRAIFNEAIAEGLIRREKCYPFGKRKYQLPNSRNTKKAISIDEIGSLYYHKPVCINEQKAKDFWMFCYFANGMNVKDVAYLKYKDIEGEYFVFIRAKTALTTRHDPKPITVYLSEDMKAIIDRWGNKDQNPNNYVFPILELGMTALEQHYCCRSFVKFINDRMKRMGKQLGITRKVTTIVSRHSFSTQLKRSGASTEFIQEALGHTDKKTTENYLDSFENSVKKEFAGMLTTFKNKH